MKTKIAFVLDLQIPITATAIAEQPRLLMHFNFRIEVLVRWIDGRN